MHVIFINYYHFVESSGIHIHFLANEFEKMGIPCTVCIPSAQELVDVFGPASYRLIQYDAMRELGFLDRVKMKLAGPVIHAWTPRELVRQFTLDLGRQLVTSYFVHMEDNEERILSAEIQIPYEKIAQLPQDELSARLPLNVIHPGQYESFLQGAIGVSCIFKTLESFVPNGIPCRTIWPACEPEFFGIPPAPDSTVRQAVGLKEDDLVLGYTGNMHKSNAEEVTSIYQAVGLLNQAGISARLLRTGSNTCDFHTDVSDIQEAYVLEMGSRPAADLRDYIAAADILIQPGASNDFNDYRFPSKLPMFLASGRPVILPPTNIGKYLKDGEECLYLRNSSVEELVDRITTLYHAPGLRSRIGAGGRAFAARSFSWEESARALLNFYQAARRQARVKCVKRILSLGLVK